MYALFPSSKTSQTPTQKQGGMLWLCLFWDHVLQGPWWSGYGIINFMYLNEWDLCSILSSWCAGPQRSASLVATQPQGGAIVHNNPLYIQLYMCVYDIDNTMIHMYIWIRLHIQRHLHNDIAVKSCVFLELLQMVLIFWCYVCLITPETSIVKWRMAARVAWWSSGCDQQLLQEKSTSGSTFRWFKANSSAQKNWENEESS